MKDENNLVIERLQVALYVGFIIDLSSFVQPKVCNLTPKV